MDFGKIGQILLITLGLYVVSALCSFIQGMIMTRNLTENDVPIEKRYYGKGQSDADGLF